MTLPAVLVVEDESSLRTTLEIALKGAGYRPVLAANLKEGKRLLDKGGFLAVLSDVKLPDGSGIDLLKLALVSPQRPPVILMTAFGTTELAVQAMKLGAFHYLSKPFQFHEVELLLKRVADSGRAKDKSAHVEASVLGTSKAMNSLMDMIRHVSASPSSILITGESGTGKELVARSVHAQSPQRVGPFVAVNCAAIPETLIESELFGYKKGSFTGAEQDKQGLFQSAHGGTLFLDEVGELPLSVQVKLLRVLQERTVRPIGSKQDQSIDVRIIAATNRNLTDMVSQGKFRDDLYYRLNVIPIHVPPLRDRSEDIPGLVDHFIKKFSLEMGKDVRGISKEGLEILKRYRFPGNVRELQNVVERAVALEHGAVISALSLPDVVRNASPVDRTNFLDAANIPLPVDLEGLLEGLERGLIAKALEECSGRKKKAAEKLGLSFRSFRYRLEKLGIESSEMESDSDSESQGSEADET